MRATGPVAGMARSHSAASYSQVRPNKKAPPGRAALVFVGYWCFSAALVLHLIQRY